MWKINKCHSSVFPLANYSVSLHQGEAFLCLPCPSTGITLWPPGAPCFSWPWPSWSEPSVAADNTWPPRRASCQWPITAPRNASSILTGPPVWPPLGWSQSWQWGWTAGTDTAPSAKKEALSCVVLDRAGPQTCDVSGSVFRGAARLTEHPLDEPLPHLVYSCKSDDTDIILNCQVKVCKETLCPLSLSLHL